MPDTKKLHLCADDFGFNAGICKGIIQLVKMHRLSAVSCMVNMPDFKKYAPELLALKDQVQIGLHFNLTDGNLLSQSNQKAFGLKELLLKSHLRMISLRDIAKEWKAQLEAFKAVMGCLPDFIDGHQHVHQLPGIRPMMLELYQQEFKHKKAYIRSTFPAITLSPYHVKVKILAMTGGKRLKSSLERMHIPHNSYFSGVYNFAKGTNYRYLFRQWLSQVPSNSLIMCHPGEEFIENDPISHARPVELAYFLSTEFLQDCQEYGVQLALPASPVSRHQEAIYCN